MANILDYLDWRGDLSVKQSPFNEVDNLIMAELAYLDFDGIVPDTAAGGDITLVQAAELFFARAEQQPEKMEMGLLIPEQIPDLLARAAATKRFGGIRLSCYETHLDEVRTEQFAALAMELEDGMVYLAFRGDG